MPSSTRTRTSGGYQLSTALVTNVHYQAASQLVTSTAEVGTREEMTDVVVRPFQPGKTWVTNPMSKQSITKTATPCITIGSCSWPPQKGDVTGWSGQKYAPSLEGKFHEHMLASDLYDYHHLNQQAATAALSGVRKPAVYGMVAVKELRSTLHTLVNPVNSIISFLRRKTRGELIREGRKMRTKLKLKENASDAANAHLAVIFGVMPFVNDVQAILKALEDGPLVMEPPTTSRGQASQSSSRSESFTGSDATYEITSTRDVVARAWITYQVDTITFAERMGFSTREIPRAIWQSLPFSFLIDWAFGVSSFIGSMQPQTGITVLSQGLSDTIIDTHLAERQNVSGSSGPWTWTESGGNEARVVVTKTRTPTKLQDFRALTIKHSREDLGVFKVTALLSLLIQRATAH